MNDYISYCGAAISMYYLPVFVTGCVAGWLVTSITCAWLYLDKKGDK